MVAAVAPAFGFCIEFFLWEVEVAGGTHHGRF